MKRLEGYEKGQWHEGPACGRRFYTYPIARSVPLTAARRLWGPWNVAAIVHIGRSRWKIANEHFHGHKNYGDEREHNYGHGQQTLSKAGRTTSATRAICQVWCARGSWLALEPRHVAPQKSSTTWAAYS